VAFLAHFFSRSRRVFDYLAWHAGYSYPVRTTRYSLLRERIHRYLVKSNDGVVPVVLLLLPVVALQFLSGSCRIPVITVVTILSQAFCYKIYELVSGLIILACIRKLVLDLGPASDPIHMINMKVTIVISLTHTLYLAHILQPRTHHHHFLDSRL
jgi:hypothetical protein